MIIEVAELDRGKNFKTNMDKHKKALFEYFQKSWKSMVDLLAEARSIEFLIRISSEIIENEEFATSKSWENFKNSSLSVTRKELDQHIDDIYGKKAGRMKSVKQLCDKLAHADYRGAKNRIDAFERKYGLMSALNSEPAKIMSVNRIMHDDGEVGGIIYKLKSNKNNLTLEEYMVFESQGYTNASIEILKLAKKEIDTQIPNMALKCSALIMSKGLRLGERVNELVGSE